MSRPTQLRYEYLINPLGIDTPRPRLSWQMDEIRRGARQSAYRIIVADSEQALTEERASIWDSGKVTSNRSLHVPFDGPALRSRQRCHWMVQIWNETDKQSPWSEPASWEMGLLNQTEWQGKWIGSRVVGGPLTMAAAPFLRREFHLDRSPISARLYATALGLYEFHINGQRAGQDVFTPGRTEYARSVQYQTYDVTPATIRQ